MQKIIPHNRLSYTEEEEKAILEVVKSGYWIGGPQIALLEKELAHKISRKFGVCVSSGFSALRLSLLALGIKKGDEVIIPAYSCVALANAVLAIDAIPISVDVEHRTWNLSFEKVKKQISKKTKAIIAVHTFGLPASIKKLKKLKIPIIEDCSHGFGKAAMGTKGDISICSLYATKFLGGGEGGIILCDSKKTRDFLIDFRDYTDKKPSKFRFNDNMTDLEASIVRVQFSRLEQSIQKRDKIAHFYTKSLDSINEGKIELPKFTRNRIWYRYVVKLKEQKIQKIIDQAEKLNVRFAKPVEEWIEEKDLKDKYPVSFQAYNSLISLPIYPSLTKEEQQMVSEIIQKILK